MGRLVQWTLPLNPPNPYPFYLQFITSALNDVLYYGKYIVDVVGELNVRARRGNVREWVIPRSLYGGAASGNITGIVRGPDDRIWFALQSANRIVRFDPATGLFTAFGSPHPLAFRSPRHLMFQGDGSLWYTGAGTQGALVGKLDATRTKTTFWDLPIDLLAPEGLWVEAEGSAVWLTPINPNIYLTGAFLARLDPAAGKLTLWKRVPPVRPVCAGVIGDAPTSPENIWFTYDDSGAASRVYRLNLRSGTFYEYARKFPFASPRRLALDAGGNAWISDWSGRVCTIKRNADCGTIAFNETTVRVRPVDADCQSGSARARPTVSNVPPRSQTINGKGDKCFVQYPLPAPLMSHAIEVSALPNRQSAVYFSQGSGIVVGRLDP